MKFGALRSRLRPRSVAGQIALLVVAAIVVAHAVATTAFVLLREPWRPDDHPGVAAGRLAIVARLLDGAAPQERAGLLANAARSVPNLQLAPWNEAAPTDAGLNRPVVRRLRNGFGRALTVVDIGGPELYASGNLRLGIATPNGARLQATLPDDALRPPHEGAIIFTVIFLALTLALLSLWATRALTAPLARLANAAEAFGTGDDHAALPEAGPQEVVAVSRALDRMRSRVRRLIDDRTQMLAAISHDLRTPITRLRLRAEFIDDDHTRTMTLRDLDQMNALVEAALSFVRDGKGGSSGTPTLIDLASVVQTVCDGFSDIGADVAVTQSRHVLVRGRPDELERAITNLVDNAVKYAGSARLAMEQTPRGIRIVVADSGPGIPESERDAMLQPFVRGDRARNLNDASGFGLGLSIVLAIVESHEGWLTLTNRPEGGLLAAIELPLAVAIPAERTEMPLAAAAE